MSYRSKRSKLGQNSKDKDTISTQTLQDVVSQVIRDVSATVDQDEDTLQSLNDDITNDVATQQPKTTVSGLVVPTAPQEKFRRTKRNSGNKGSLISSTSEPFVNDSQPSKPNEGVESGKVQAEETEIGSAVDVEPIRTEPAQVTAKETNAAGRTSLTPPPRRIESLRNLIDENDGEPLQHEFPSSSRWDDELELDEGEEEEEIDGEPDQLGLSRTCRTNMSKWNNDIAFDEMEEVEMRDADGKRGKKSGRILPRHVWALRPGVRFVVPFNSLAQPVRKGGYVLIRFLGDVAKNSELCPIGEVNWHKVNKSCKAKIIALIREKFILPDGPEIDKCILKHVGNKWRNHRHDLKLQYKKPDKTQEQVASVVPPGVPPTQWVKLVRYWFSEKCKIFSRAGKEARDAQLHNHVSGSKSYARRRDEFEKEHGREPGALEWFLKTHQKKDGTFLQNSSKEFADTAAALIAKRQRGSTSSNLKEVENQVFNELMYSDEERYQRPLGYGFGVTGNQVFDLKSESKKRGYTGLGIIKGEIGSSKKKLFRERRNNGYMDPDSTEEVERLNFAVMSMGEMNQLMQSQIKMQSKQLRRQSHQLELQSKQIEGLQVQLQKVTSLLTKFGARLNNPQTPRMSKGLQFKGVSSGGGANRQVAYASSEYSDEESDSTNWDSDE